MSVQPEHTSPFSADDVILSGKAVSMRIRSRGTAVEDVAEECGAPGCWCCRRGLPRHSPLTPGRSTVVCTSACSFYASPGRRWTILDDKLDMVAVYDIQTLNSENRVLGVRPNIQWSMPRHSPTCPATRAQAGTRTTPALRNLACGQESGQDWAAARVSEIKHRTSACFESSASDSLSRGRITGLPCTWVG